MLLHRKELLLSIEELLLNGQRAPLFLYSYWLGVAESGKPKPFLQPEDGSCQQKMAETQGKSLEARPTEPFEVGFG